MSVKLPEKYQDRSVLTKKEAAEALHISESKLDEMIDEGKIEVKDWGYRTKRIAKEELEKL